MSLCLWPMPRVRCWLQHLMHPQSNIGESHYFQEAMRTGVFTVGDYTLLKTPRRVVIQFAQPITGIAGNPVGILVAAFDLSYFGSIFFDTHLPERSVFTLTDAKGMRLTRFPEPEKYTWVTDLPQMVARMSGRDAEGTFLETGVDGVSRLYSFKRLHFQGASFPYLMIRLGMPVDQALREARFVSDPQCRPPLPGNDPGAGYRLVCE